MTLQPLAEKNSDHLRWAGPLHGLLLARCTVLVWFVCSSLACMPTLLTELQTQIDKSFKVIIQYIGLS